MLSFFARGQSLDGQERLFSEFKRKREDLNPSNCSRFENHDTHHHWQRYQGYGGKVPHRRYEGERGYADLTPREVAVCRWDFSSQVRQVCLDDPMVQNELFVLF